MARPTKNQLVSDVMLRLTQAAPSQDLEIPDSQVAFWFNQILGKLIPQEIARLLDQGKQIPQAYITREYCKQLTEETTPCVPNDDDGTKQRYWFALSQRAVDVEDDNGIVQVLTNELDEIFKASIQQMPMLKAMRFTAPSSQLLLWSRQEELLYVEGFKESDLDLNKIIVFYVPKQDMLTMADTDEVFISDKLVEVAIEQVTAIGLQELYGSVEDKTNDGSQDQQLLVKPVVTPQPLQ